MNIYSLILYLSLTITSNADRLLVVGSEPHDSPTNPRPRSLVEISITGETGRCQLITSGHSEIWLSNSGYTALCQPAEEKAPWHIVRFDSTKGVWIKRVIDDQNWPFAKLPVDQPLDFYVSDHLCQAAVILDHRKLTWFDLMTGIVLHEYESQGTLDAPSILPDGSGVCFYENPRRYPPHIFNHPRPPRGVSEFRKINLSGAIVAPKAKDFETSRSGFPSKAFFLGDSIYYKAAHLPRKEGSKRGIESLWRWNGRDAHEPELVRRSDTVGLTQIGDGMFSFSDINDETNNYRLNLLSISPDGKISETVLFERPQTIEGGVRTGGLWQNVSASRMYSFGWKDRGLYVFKAENWRSEVELLNYPLVSFYKAVWKHHK